jgi:hypothetical protein
MADKVKKVSYFAMEVPNRPGQGARLLAQLAEEGVNLLAFSGFPSGRGAQLDFVPEKAPAFLAAAKRAKIRVRPKKAGFLIQGDDRPGAVAVLLKKLADKRINVTAIDAVTAGKGRWGAILWVKQKDVNKAAKILGAR